MKHFSYGEHSRATQESLNSHHTIRILAKEALHTHTTITFTNTQAQQIQDHTNESKVVAKLFWGYKEHERVNKYMSIMSFDHVLPTYPHKPCASCHGLNQQDSGIHEVYPYSS